MFLHQSAYRQRILERFRMTEAKAVFVSTDPHVMLEPVKSKGGELCNAPYREAVESLMFLATVSCPDIANAVNTVSFLNSPGESHWRAVKQIFAFIIGTRNLGITYQSGGSKSDLMGYSDADYASDLETRQSTTGYIFSLANGPVL
ncbi:integrase core domain protein [Lasius niger]|uniref:Integrase core domain protein n=1 Tax=Lasius niger TaxID=67767 RepID=A0A0J7MMF5_LASNI|nr:integrase core domain protein [Lasius niger]